MERRKVGEEKKKENGRGKKESEETRRGREKGKRGRRGRQKRGGRWRWDM